MSAPTLPPRYREPSFIGEGATGVVWQARDTLADELVAIKIVRRHLAILDRFRARFAREVALSARLVHDNIVPVRDFGRLDDGSPYVVMDLATQGSLAERLASGVPLGRILDWIDDVLAALAHLHARGLVHRDIKPENVLLADVGEGRPRAWVADFGLAGARTEVAFTGESVAGTREWMSPEQADGRVQELGPWSDLYAVGLLLNVAMGGAPVRLTRAARGDRFTPSRVRLPSEVAPALARLIDVLLHSDPRQRFDRAADARRALAAARADLSDDVAAASVSSDALPTSSTIFPVPLTRRGLVAVANLSPKDSASDGNAPSWNRVAPSPLPDALPEPVGLGSPAHAIEVVSLRQPPPPARPEEQRILWEAAREVVQSARPKVILLVGRDGSGKGRLADSVAEVLDEGAWMEVITLRYHDPPAEDDGYRGAVLELLAPWNDGRADAEERIAGWLARDRGVGTDAVIDEAHALARWCGYREEREPPINASLGLTYLLRHLDARGWRGGAALVLQDAHFTSARADGLGICRALLEETVGVRPVLAVATLSRDAVESEPLAAEVAQLQQLGAVRVDVDRLEASAMSDFLQRALSVEEELADAIAPHCGGSPTFATLLIRDWGLRHLIQRRGDGRFVLCDGMASDDLELIVPRTIDDLAARRVDGALAVTESPNLCAQALAVAAIAGQAPPAQVVREASGEALDHLLGTGLVSQRGFRLVFEAHCIRDVVVRRAMAQANLRQIHGRLASAWAELGDRVGADVDLSVGRHRLGAGQHAEAVVPLLRATRSNIASGRVELGLRAGRLALEAATGADRQMARVEARQLMAEALLGLHRAEEAAELLHTSGQDWRMDRRSRARDAVLRARAAIATGALDSAARLLDSAAAGYEATRDRSGMAVAAFEQARLVRVSGHPLKAVERYSRMLRIVRERDLQMRVEALSGRIECFVAAGRVAEAVSDLRELQEVARQSLDTRNIARAAFVTGLLRLTLGEYHLAERHLRTALALAATLGDDRTQMECHNVLGETARLAGDREAAAARYRHAVRVARRLGWAPRAAVAHLNLAMLYLGEDDVAARREHAAAAELIGRDNSHWVRIFVALFSACWSAEAGSMELARTQLQDAVEAGLARLPLPDAGVLLSRLANAARERGAAYLEARARELAGELQLPMPQPEPKPVPVVRMQPAEDPADAPTVIFKRMATD
ncbi:MAG: hypothetical protein CMJ34_13975 [Phycisphaerae bacterium]|nr:hypothetical protein [Phycisphaerae bacterium]